MSQTTVSFSAQGTALYVKRAGLGWKEIAQIKTMGGPGTTSKIADVSTLSSPSGYEEKKPLMKSLSPVALSIIWDPSDATITYLQTSNATYPQALEEFLQVASDPNLRTCHFFAYVTKFEPHENTNEVGMMTIELTPTGAPGFSFGLSPA
jgi:hypothetical protein